MEHLFDRLNLEHGSQKQYISMVQPNALKYFAIAVVSLLPLYI